MRCFDWLESHGPKTPPTRFDSAARLSSLFLSIALDLSCLLGVATVGGGQSSRDTTRYSPPGTLFWSSWWNWSTFLEILTSFQPKLILFLYRIVPHHVRVLCIASTRTNPYRTTQWLFQHHRSFRWHRYRWHFLIMKAKVCSTRWIYVSTTWISNWALYLSF